MMNEKGVVFAPVTGKQCERVEELFSEDAEDFVKITIHDPLLNCFETKERLSQFFESAYIVASEAAWIDIANANVHKGTTVEYLQRLLNVTPEETMAFGDGYNDIELMTRSTYSFAVRNAVQEIKDAANYITRSNEEDAVMKTIIQLLSLQKDEKLGGE